jgi:hypothetical protein
MSYWDGSRWIDTEASSVRKTSSATNWAATTVMVIGLVALLLPMGGTFAAGRKSSPTLTVACGTTCEVGGSLTVRGSGFTPSSGGQQVILWVEYPDDYCGASACHGFYYQPWVGGDGTFSHTFDNALLQAGEGGVEAIQYNAKTDKWVEVSYVDYRTNY